MTNGHVTAVGEMDFEWSKWQGLEYAPKLLSCHGFTLARKPIERQPIPAFEHSPNVGAQP
jgi:hypothetical protein